MNYKPYNPEDSVTTKWTETFKAWKQSVDNKETTFRLFINQLIGSHYYAYMNFPVEGDNEYDRGFLTISPQDTDATFIAVYTTIKELESSIPKPTDVAPGRKLELVEVNYAFLVSELARANPEMINGIVINPFTDDYVLTVQDMSDIAKRICTGLNHTEDLGNYTPANIYIKDAWTFAQNADEKQRGEIFKSVLDAIDDAALFALPVSVNKNDIITKNGEVFIADTDADLTIRTISSNDENGKEVKMIALFTSQDDIEKLEGWNSEDDQNTTLLLTLDFNSHMQALNNGFDFEAIVINPFTDNIVLTTDLLQDMGFIDKEESADE